MQKQLYFIIILTVLFIGNCTRTQTNKALHSYSTAPVTAESVREGLVLQMSFDRDETAAQTVTDASGRANHGIPYGVKWTAAGIKGGAYEFTADGNRIEIPNNASLNPGQFTLAAWIKTSVQDDKWRRIFDKSYTDGFAMSIASDWEGNHWSGQACLEIAPGSHFSLTRSMVADGQWHQVVATFDGREQLFFVDGLPEGMPLQWDSTGQVGKTDFNLFIGCNLDKNVSFRGVIDEPMVWSRALSVREVAFLYGTYPAVNKESGNRSESVTKNDTPIKELANVIHLSDNDVRFKTAAGTIILVDPVTFPTDEFAARTGMVKPDLILITHSHSDHFQPTMLLEYMKLNPKAFLAGPADVVRMIGAKGINAQEIKPDQDYSMAGVKFKAVPAYFEDHHPKSNGWVGYILQLDGVSYYVTGDTQPLPEMANLKVDVLMPLLFGCGGNLDQAVKLAELTRAPIVVPVHHSGQEGTIKQYIAKLPDGVRGYYYLNGEIVTTK
ncbi:MAG TPA: MBL fold metallo-hydrolase [bacterium]|nr:MBL fold metallo-hydrolase [bacterium]HPN43516.1 MBL fold metallo-hydrolase [bacterium]